MPLPRAVGTSTEPRCQESRKVRAKSPDCNSPAPFLAEFRIDRITRLSPGENELLEMDDHDRPVVCIHPGGAALHRRIASDFLRVNALYFGEGRLPIV